MCVYPCFSASSLIYHPLYPQCYHSVRPSFSLNPSVTSGRTGSAVLELMPRLPGYVACVDTWDHPRNLRHSALADAWV